MSDWENDHDTRIEFNPDQCLGAEAGTADKLFAICEQADSAKAGCVAEFESQASLSYENGDSWSSEVAAGRDCQTDNSHEHSTLYAGAQIEFGDNSLTVGVAIGQGELRDGHQMAQLELHAAELSIEAHAPGELFDQTVSIEATLGHFESPIADVYAEPTGDGALGARGGFEFDTGSIGVAHLEVGHEACFDIPFSHQECCIGVTADLTAGVGESLLVDASMGVRESHLQVGGSMFGNGGSVEVACYDERDRR